MDSARYRRVRAIFTAALDVIVSERSRFIEAECGGDADLRREVESLFSELSTSQGVSLDDAPGRRLREAIDEGHGEQSSSVELPDSVGDYRVLRCLGEGGMGVVYEAEQQQPRRRVAVKVLRPGLATPSLVKRFRLEAELLGRLQHPGIARVYEAGEGRPWGGTGPEQPYLVMEHVEGSPLTAWAARRKLPLNDRLELLARVCDGVQHAHERGVVHRDLKPANVLVDPTGQPRILDFGVARALDSDIAMGTAHTGTSQLVGTLPYMSPEQLGGHADELGPLSDVYALGVLAYELLAGRLPLQLAGLPLGEAIDRVQDVDPPSLGGLDDRFEGDIEAIVSKALEKEPQRRYASAGEMAADLRRVLAEEPIRARPQSSVYRTMKFVRRNRRFVAAVACAFIVLIVGVAATSFLALSEAGARREAEQSRDEALRATYRAQLGSAFAALRDGHAESALAQLSRAPEALRDWTWAVARARLDDSTAMTSLVIGDDPRLVNAGHGRFVAWGSEGLAFLQLERNRLVQEEFVSGRFVGLSRDGRRALETLGGDLRVRVLAPGPAVAGSVADAMLLADGSWLLAHPEGWVRVGADGRELGRLTGRRLKGRFGSGLSPDGSWSFVEDESGAALVDPISARRLVDLGLGVTALAPSQDGRRVLVARPGVLERVDPASSGRPPEVLIPDFEVAARSLTPAPLGTLLSVVDDSLAVTVWDLATGQRVARAGVLDYGVPVPSWSRDGQRLLVPDRTGVLRQVEARTGRVLRPWLVGHAVGATALEWSDDGSRVLVLASDGALRAFVAPSLSEPRRLRGHEGYVYGVDFAPGGRRLASVAWDGSLRTWDAWAGTPSTTQDLPEDVGLAVDVHPDGRHAVVSYTGAVRWVSLSGDEGRTLLEGSKAADAVLSASGRLLAVGTGKGEAIVRDLASGKDLFSWSTPESGARAAVALAPDESAVFIACGSELMRVGLRDGDITWRSGDAGDVLIGVTVSPDGATLAASGRTGLVSAWDARTGELTWRVRSPGAPTYAVAFHPSGAPLVTGSQDGVVRSWRVGEQEPLAELRCHDDYVYGLSFSDDGDLLASASADTTICLWDAKSRAERTAALARD